MSLGTSSRTSKMSLGTFTMVSESKMRPHLALGDHQDPTKATKMVCRNSKMASQT